MFQLMHSWWVYDAWQISPVFLISWVFWVVLSICLHELGHGFAAIRCGDRTPIELGHMTLNPIVHMGLPSLITFAVAGLAWGAMPVTPSRFRGRHDDAFVSFAGPFVNISLMVTAGLAAVAWALLAGGMVNPAWEVNDTLYTNVQVFLMVGAGLNLGLTLLNLIPVPPLDGSRILSSFVPAYRELTQRAGNATAVGAIIVIVLFGPSILDFGFAATSQAIHTGVRLFAPQASFRR